MISKTAQLKLFREFWLSSFLLVPLFVTSSTYPSECMKSYLPLIIGLALPNIGQAQNINLCSSGRPDTSICAKSILKSLRFENGKPHYKNAPIYYICSSEEGTVNINFGNSELYRKVGFQINCEDVAYAWPFNNKVGGLKHGIWFELTALGKLKRAIQYDSGRVELLFTFWPNGLPKTGVKYKPSGQPVIGSSMSFEKQ